MRTLREIIIENIGDDIATDEYISELGYHPDTLDEPTKKVFENDEIVIWRMKSGLFHISTATSEFCSENPLADGLIDFDTWARIEGERTSEEWGDYVRSATNLNELSQALKEADTKYRYLIDTSDLFMREYATLWAWLAIETDGWGDVFHHFQFEDDWDYPPEHTISLIRETTTHPIGMGPGGLLIISDGEFFVREWRQTIENMDLSNPDEDTIRWITVMGHADLLDD